MTGMREFAIPACGVEASATWLGIALPFAGLRKKTECADRRDPTAGARCGGFQAYGPS